ncbi:MAG: alpha/beta hydrolase, partial [Acidimicrobiia bacterium]|nr:alpha/beta hydrolase [Acidimicrobiia bacterium]
MDSPSAPPPEPRPPTGDRAGEPAGSAFEGWGLGVLSPEARERLARPPGKPLRPPPLDDHGAVARWRAQVHAAWLAGDPPAGACGHEQVTLAGVRCLWTPGPAAGPGDRPLATGGPIVVYFHGGGYALGSPEVALPITQRLAAGGLGVVSVGYRLAPEHPWPAAVTDAVAVFRAVRKAAPGRRLAVGGDSAGGNLALSVAQRTRHDGDAGGGPGAMVLFSPHLDHGGPLRRGDDTDEAGAAWLRAAYCGSADPADPRISPLRGDLSGLPTTLVQVGTRDGLLGQAARFARAARRAGNDVTLDVWDGLWHTWQYHRDLPEADQALAEAAAFVIAVPSR